MLPVVPACCYYWNSIQKLSSHVCTRYESAIPSSIFSIATSTELLSLCIRTPSAESIELNILWDNQSGNVKTDNKQIDRKIKHWIVLVYYWKNFESRGHVNIHFEGIHWFSEFQCMDTALNLVSKYTYNDFVRKL